jgi:hypothetical protein
MSHEHAAVCEIHEQFAHHHIKHALKGLSRWIISRSSMKAANKP